MEALAACCGLAEAALEEGCNLVITESGTAADVGTRDPWMTMRNGSPPGHATLQAERRFEDPCCTLSE
jgi:hypothetical protein